MNGAHILLLGLALPASEEIIAQLCRHQAVLRAELRAEPAGSIHRMRETIGDIDILAASDRPSEAIEAFCKPPEVREVLAAGPTKATLLVGGDLQTCSATRLVASCAGAKEAHWTSTR